MKTLALGFKPKTSWLSMVSLIVLCTMAFLVIPSAFAAHCLEEHVAVTIARAAVETATAGRDLAQAAVANAEGLARLAAIAALALAEWALNMAEANHDAAVEALQACLKEHDECPCGCGDQIYECDCDDPEENSGGCDSGGCDSGGCDSGGCDSGGCDSGGCESCSCCD